jgi:hypothetical protein
MHIALAEDSVENLSTCAPPRFPDGRTLPCRERKSRRLEFNFGRYRRRPRHRPGRQCGSKSGGCSNALMTESRRSIGSWSTWRESPRRQTPAITQTPHLVHGLLPRICILLTTSRTGAFFARRRSGVRSFQDEMRMQLRPRILSLRARTEAIQCQPGSFIDAPLRLLANEGQLGAHRDHCMAYNSESCSAAFCRIAIIRSTTLSAVVPIGNWISCATSG